MSVLQIRAELGSFCVRNCPKDFSRGRGNGNHGKLLAFDVFASALGSLGVNKLPCAKGVDLVSARHKNRDAVLPASLNYFTILNRLFLRNDRVVGEMVRAARTTSQSDPALDHSARRQATIDRNGQGCRAIGWYCH